MEELLKDLHEVLKKYDAWIVRSANNSGDLYLGFYKDGKEIEVKFNEDITQESIEYGWHTEPPTN